MRAFLVVLLLAFVGAQAYSRLPTTDGEGCPEGHRPGEKFDMKPGCSQCICHRNPADGHFCRQCPPLPEIDLPAGLKKEFDNTRPYPTCCYPKYVRT